MIKICRPAVIALLALAQPALLAATPPSSAKANIDPDAAAIEKASVLVLTGKEREAIAILDKVIARQSALPVDAGKRVYCARSMVETLAYMALAAQDRVSAVALPPTLADAIFLKAWGLVNLGQLDEAQPLFERAIALSPYNARYLGELAEIHKVRKDWPTALDTFKRADAAAAFSPDERKSFEQRRAWRGIGFVLIEMGQLDEAATYFEKCLALDPGDTRARGELDYLDQQRRRQARPQS